MLIAAGLVLLLAFATVLRVVVRRRRLVVEQPAPFQIEAARFPGGREFIRVYGDRVRVALDDRGAHLLIAGLGLAAAIVLGALVAG